MLLPEHQYVKATSLEDCLGRLQDGQRDDKSDRETGIRPGIRPGIRVVAGGTDVIFNMRLKLFQPDVALSIRNLECLQQVEELPGGGLRIGAGCTLASLEKHPLITVRFPALAAAIQAVASTHVRNMATLGGNICLDTRCWYTNNSEQWREGLAGCFKTDGQLCHVIKSSTMCHAINNADTPVALIMLGAVLTLQSAGSSRAVPIAEFYRRDGLKHTVMKPDEILTHVEVPKVSARTTFIKIAPRIGMDFSLAAVAARAGGTGLQASDVAIVLGSLTTAPVFLHEPARTAEAGGLSDESIERAVEQVRVELGELTNLYGRPGYKKHLANVLVRRALEDLREK